MDYGYRMLRHVVAQVFGNFGQAISLTFLPTFLPMVVLLGLFMMWGVSFTAVGAPFADPGPNASVNDGVVFLTVLGGVVVSMITYCWAAVGWHRYILLEEHGNGLMPRWHGSMVLSYLGRSMLIGLIAIGVAIGGLLALGALILAVPVPAVALLLTFGFSTGLTWVVTRIGLILPAAALGRPMRIGESWQATGPVSGHLLVPVLFITLAMTILNQLVVVIFGASSLGMIPLALIYWIQILLNLSLMTTLYGTQIEGRHLN